MFTRSKSKKRKLHHLEDLNPPPSKKTRKKDSVNPISSKKTRKKDSKNPISSKTYSKYPPLTTINLNDISQTPTKTIPSSEDDWRDIESIINQPISTTPTHFNNLEQYENLAPIDETDWSELANSINETDPSPDDVDFNNLEQYENLAPIDETDWSELANFINETDCPTDDVDFNNLEQYENLAPIDETDWSELANFINETDCPTDDVDFNNLEQYENLASINQQDLDDILKTPITQIPTPIINTPPIENVDNNTTQNLYIYQTVFTTEQLISLSSIVNGIDLEDTTKFTLSTEIPSSSTPPKPSSSTPPKPSSSTPPKPSSSTPPKPSSPQPSKPSSSTPHPKPKQSFKITSDQLFKIMKHSANSSIKELKLNPNIFKPIEDPYLDDIIDKYNKTVLAKSLSSPDEIRKRTGFSSNIRKNNSKIFSFIKSNYLEIYPAQRILGLIEKNPNELECICFLDHEEELIDTLHTLKTKQNDFRSTPSLRPNRIAIRLKVMQDLIKKIKQIFKNTYKLN
ncbi:MAG: hypothetical protein KFW09_04785 [Oscillospiraceae bacterium]|nr:hypothetical protein [Oscillospiraceae bacterium]